MITYLSRREKTSNFLWYNDFLHNLKWEDVTSNNYFLIKFIDKVNHTDLDFHYIYINDNQRFQFEIVILF